MICKKCKRDLDSSLFYKHKTNLSGLSGHCKDCSSKTNKARKKAVRSSLSIQERRDIELKRKYDCSIEQYDLMFLNQEGRCLICNKHQSELNEILCVDHSHSSNKIRGLLCSSCNKGLGFFKDNPALLSNAIAYLARTDDKIQYNIQEKSSADIRSS